MAYSLVVRGGTVVSEFGIVRADVAIDRDRVAGIIAPSEHVSGERVIDASGKHVFPGFVDGHVHFRDPGFTHKGDFTTESTAAVFGGVTTVIDGPNTGTVVLSAADVREKQSLGEQKSHVDFGQIAALTSANCHALAELADSGVVAVKIFMGYKYALSGLPLAPPEDGPLVDALHEVARLGMRLSVHAENGDIITHLRDRFRKEGRTHPADHIASRPAYGEADAISTVLRFAEHVGARLEIRHLSCAEGLPLVRAAKERGLDVVLETCPHYLFFEDQELIDLGPRAIINPPIRTAEHRDALLEGIRSGVIDTIGTDHGPSAPDEKFRDNLWDVAPGFTAVELAVPLLLTLVRDGKLDLADVPRLFAANTAKAWGLFPRKGSLRPGADADVTIVDLDAPWRIDEDGLHGMHNITPFRGREVSARVLTVVRRGQVLLHEGEFVADEPGGKMVTPWFSDEYVFDCVRGPRLRHSPSVATVVS